MECSSVVLRGGQHMPVIGLGTWQATPEVVQEAVLSALQVGYRLIDTAYNYGNEAAIGKALRLWLDQGGSRQDVFVTTKLPNFGNRASDVFKYLEESLHNLGLEYVDLYLVHHPFGFHKPPQGTSPPDLDVSTDHAQVWQEMERAVTAGLAKNIGLSNFNAQQVKKLAQTATILPSNLQVELHAFLQQPELVQTCKDLGLSITAYAPLGSPSAKQHFKHKYDFQSNDVPDALTEPTVIAIADRIGRTPAQILLRFLIQEGICVVPKSASKARIAENFKALEFALDKDDINSLRCLDRGEQGRLFDFLFYKGVDNHPEDSTLECHIKSEMPGVGLVDSPTGYVMTIDNTTSYVTVEGARYAGDFSTYLRDREKPEYPPQESLYSLSQRFENPAIAYELQRASGKEDDTNAIRVQKPEGSETSDNSEPRHYHRIRLCVYLMSKVALHLDLEDRYATAQDLTQAILQDEQLALPRIAAKVFTLWISSGLVELQLKPHYKPFELRQHWRDIIKQYSSASDARQRRDEPSVTLQRNIYYSRKEEEQLKDHKILDQLYEEARFNILEGRYPCEPMHYVSLGGIQARIEMGPFNAQVHTIQFFREHQARFLPHHLINPATSLLRISGKHSPEVRLQDQYRRIPANTPHRKLVHKYLEFCWALPYYGSAFFHGQVEQPVRGLTSLLTHQDIPVLVGINAQGIYVIDHVQCILLLGLKYAEMSWDYAKPSQENNPDCLPCLFIQFMVLENGTRVSKILQVFSKQAVLMDALISMFVERSRRKVEESEVDGRQEPEDSETQASIASRREMLANVVSNKLSKLTLATFDDNGHCIGQMGSWSFSY